MKSIYTKLALYGINNFCAKTDNVFFPISEVCDGTVSLSTLKALHKTTCSISLKKNNFSLPLAFQAGTAESLSLKDYN